MEISNFLIVKGKGSKKVLRINSFTTSEICLKFATLFAFRPQERGKTSTPFMLRSARRSSEAGKPEVQFSFIELSPSVCSCLSGKARILFLSELRLSIPSPPIPAFS